MNHAGPVRILERGEDSLDNADSLIGVDRAGLDQVFQKNAVDVLHDDERQLRFVAVGLPYGLFTRVEDAHDRRVGHSCRGLRLLAEARAEGGVGCERRLEQLDGDRAAQARVCSPVHVGHPAAPDQLAHLISAREQAAIWAQCELLVRGRVSVSVPVVFWTEPKGRR